MPFIPGMKWAYEGLTDEGLERQVVEVLEETRMINGVEATVVRDTVYVNGEIRKIPMTGMLRIQMETSGIWANSPRLTRTDCLPARAVHLSGALMARYRGS